MIAGPNVSVGARISLRFFAVVIAAAMSLSLCACAAPGEDAAQPAQAAPSAAEDAR